MRRYIDRIVLIAALLIGLWLAYDDLRAWVTGEPPVLVGGAAQLHSQMGGKHAALHR